MKKTTRKITPKEIKIARKSHFIAIPIFIIAPFIIYILLQSNKIPDIPKYAGIAIATLAMLIIIGKIIQLERELKHMEIEEIVGIITNKIKFGGTSKKNSGGVMKSGRRSSQTTYIIKIDDEKFWVKPKFYKIAQINKKVKMLHLKKSQVLISLDILD
jgi:hypothetical protein